MKKLGFIKLQNGLVELVEFSTRKSSKKITFLIGGGCSKITQWDEVLETFEVKPEEYLTELANLTAKFYRTYHPPTAEIKESGGWISPTGKFYPVNYCCHSTVASKLTLCLYDSNEGDSLLEDKGWIHLATSGYALFYGKREGKKVTQAQIDTMHDIYMIAEDPTFKEYLRKDIDRYAETYL